MRAYLDCLPCLLSQALKATRAAPDEPAAIDAQNGALANLQNNERGITVHATIQKPIEEIVTYFKPGERAFVVGCDNCATKCHSGGIPETEEMANRLKKRGVNVIGWCVPPDLPP